MPRICTVDGCTNIHYGSGCCSKHHARLRRNGAVDRLRKSPNGSCLEWLNNNIHSQTDDCIIWPMGTGSHGYGVLIAEGKRKLAHRYVCGIAHGNPPERADAAHSCGNRLCVNPRHLRWASRAENEADKISHGRAVRGTRHGCSRLNDDQVRAIRAAKGPQRDIAKAFGVAQQTVSDIKVGRRWAWL